MGFDAHKNFAIGTVATPPSPALSGITLSLLPGQGTLMPTPPFNATVYPPNQQANSANGEIIRVLSMSGDNVTSMLRSQEGTSPIAIVAGDQISNTITAKTIQDIEAAASSPSVTSPNAKRQYAFLNGLNYGYHSDATTHGWTGAVDVQMFCWPFSSDGVNVMIPVCQWNTTGNKRSWQARVDAGNNFGFQISPAGTSTSTTITGPPVTTLPETRPVWLRWYYLPNDGTGNYQFQMYYSYVLNPTSTDWVPFGSLHAGATVAVYNAAPTGIYVGQQENGALPVNTGWKVYRVRGYDGSTPIFDVDFRPAAVPPATIADLVTNTNLWSPLASAVLQGDLSNWQDFDQTTPTVLPFVLSRRGRPWNVITDGKADPNVGDLDPYKAAIQARLTAGDEVLIPPRNAAPAVVALPSGAGVYSPWVFTPGAGAAAFLDLNVSGVALRGSNTIIIPKPGADGEYHGDVFSVSADDCAITGFKQYWRLGSIHLASTQTVSPTDTNFTFNTTGAALAQTWPASGFVVIQSNRSQTLANANEACILHYTSKGTNQLLGCTWVIPPKATRAFTTTPDLVPCAGDGAFVRIQDDCTRTYLDDMWNIGYWWDAFAVGSERLDQDWVVSTTAGSNVVTRVSGPAFTNALENRPMGAIDPIGLGVFGCAGGSIAFAHFVDANTLTLFQDNTGHTTVSNALTTQSAARMHTPTGTAKSLGGVGGGNSWEWGAVLSYYHVYAGLHISDDLDNADLGNNGISAVKFESSYAQYGIRTGAQGQVRIGHGKCHSANVNLSATNRLPRSLSGSGPGTAAGVWGEMELEDAFYRGLELGVDSFANRQYASTGHLHILMGSMSDAAIHIDNNIFRVALTSIDVNIIQATANQCAVLQFNTPQEVNMSIDNMVINDSSKWASLIRCLNGQVPSGVTVGPGISGLKNSLAWLKTYADGGRMPVAPTTPLTAYPTGAAAAVKWWDWLPKYRVVGLAASAAQNAWILGIPNNHAYRIRLVFTGTGGGNPVLVEQLGILTRGNNSTDAPIWTPDGSPISTGGANAPTLDFGAAGANLTNANGVGYAQPRILAGSGQIDGRLHLTVEAASILSIDLPQSGSVLVVGQ